MGFKEQIKNVLKEFNQLKNRYDLEKRNIKNNGMYSDEYKEELIKKTKLEFMKQQEYLKNEALNVTAITKQKLLSSKTKVDKDHTFEVALSNTLKILETVGADMDTEELRELINPFEKDYYTMKVLRKVFVKNNLEGTQEIFGIDNIDHNISIVESLEKDISYVFTSDIENANSMKLSIAIEMMQDIQ